MALGFPNADLPGSIRGGSELFDAEALIDADFFAEAAPPPTGTQIKVFNGLQWITGSLMRWTGSAWQAETLKRWNGTAWVNV